MAGDDFAYYQGRQNFNNLDKAIKALNERQEEYGIFAKYSTPSLFFKEATEGVELSTYELDFMNYESKPYKL